MKVSAGGGSMKWRPVLAIRGIHIRSELHQNLCKVNSHIINLQTSVGDPWHFNADPDLRIHTSD